MATEKRQVYKCLVCGIVAEVLEGGAGEPVCCGRPMQLLSERTSGPGEEMHVPSAVHSRRLLDFAFTRYEKMADLHKWLLSLTREELPPG